MRRFVPITALLVACTCGERQELSEPPVVVAPVGCGQAWTGQGDLAPRPVSEWERLTLEEAARGLGMSPECENRVREGAYTVWSCEWSGDEWGFSVDLMEFDNPEDASWAVKDPYPGEVFVQEDSFVLQIEARNGACGEQLLEGVLSETRPETQNDQSVRSALEARGWGVEECTMESFDGTHSIDCTAFRGQDHAVQFDVAWSGDGAGERRKTEREDGLAWWWYVSGESTAIVHDGVAARALATLMVP